MVVFNISIWTGLVGEGVGMVAKWQHGKVYFQEKGKDSLTKIILVFTVRNLKKKKEEDSLTEIISVFTFAYFVSEKFDKKEEDSFTEMVGRECSDWSWQELVGWLVVGRQGLVAKCGKWQETGCCSVSITSHCNLLLPRGINSFILMFSCFFQFVKIGDIIRCKPL